MTRHICDGHEYRTRETEDQFGGFQCFDNYASLVAGCHRSPCKEYWTFKDATGEHYDTYHVSNLEGFTIEQQLVRWFAAVSS